MEGMLLDKSVKKWAYAADSGRESETEVGLSTEGEAEEGSGEERGGWSATMAKGSATKAAKINKATATALTIVPGLDEGGDRGERMGWGWADDTQYGPFSLFRGTGKPHVADSPRREVIALATDQWVHALDSRLLGIRKNSDKRPQTSSVWTGQLS